MRRLLALIAAVLGAILLLQWKDWPPAPRSKPDGESSVNGTTSNPSEPNPLSRLVPLESKDAYASVNERTLFRPQRRPPEPSPESESPMPLDVAGSLAGVDLNAIVIAPGLAQAWVSDASGLRRLRPGDPYEGWTVKDIRPDSLVLERQGIANTIVLQDFSKAAATSPPGRKPPDPLPSKRSEAKRVPQSPASGQASRKDGRAATPRPPTAPAMPPQARPDAAISLPPMPE